MKITKLSMVAIATMAMTTGAMADVDMKIGGQSVIYYQTSDANGNGDLFSQDTSRANAGLQLNANGDLGNGFGLGLQGTALGSLGLENNLVSNTMQTAKTESLNGIALTKAYLTKQIANTTLKMGRQELPKSLSPLAFSESWNVFKNTFDAALAINSDIPNTTLVGAYVANSNGDINGGRVGLVDLGNFSRVGAKGAYMLTAQNKSVQNTTLTGSYYALPSTDLSAVWLDAQVKNLGPVGVALQGGMVMNDATGGNDTTGLGVKVSGKAGTADLSLAYSTVDDGDVPIHNVGTGVKTPLYTQMILNQGAIKKDADTVVLKAAMPLSAGKVIAQYGLTTDNSAAGNDYNELDLIYKFKALGTNMLAAYVRADSDNADANNILRFWTRYNF